MWTTAANRAAANAPGYKDGAMKKARQAPGFFFSAVV
jgi:hypothetical protein